MYKQIVVGTDGSAGANVAVDTAIELARLTGAGLRVVHAQKVMTAYQLVAAAEVGVVPDIAESNEAIHAEGQRICDEVAKEPTALA
jgi:nucleotide-binding universal stress UspA family protein